MDSARTEALNGLYCDYAKAYCRLLRRHFGAHLRGVLLYGSVARGEAQRDSDIDILLVVDAWHDTPVWDRLQELHRIQARLRATRLYKQIRSVAYPPSLSDYPLSLEEAEDYHPIYLDILLHHRILFDREGYLAGRLSRLQRTVNKLQAERIPLASGGYYWRFQAIQPGDVVQYE